MQATLAAKQEKDFMNMNKIKLCLLLLVPVMTSYGQPDEPIPLASFTEISINITFPQYRPLANDGGFVEIDGGVRGIIVYRVDASTFIAYERNCTYQAGAACAQVEVDLSRLFLIDRCCGSNFSFSDGYPTKGPASYALRRYRTDLAGSTLTITDEVVN
jgi:hypothetical protein